LNKFHELTYSVPHYFIVLNTLIGEVIMNLEEKQLDHVERMKKSSEENPDHWINIMKIRYPVYMGLIKKYKKTGSMLDIGCGFADVWYSEYVKVSGYSYYCTDISDETVLHMTNLLSVNGNDTFAKKGVLDNLPWPNSEFDIVYASHVLEHCEDIGAVFTEIKRILKKDGILLFAVPCGYDDEPAHTHNRELFEWKEDFQNNGWQILESGQFDFNLNEFYGVAVPTGVSHAN
jgi:SAM-dependent methyltransferase